MDVLANHFRERMLTCLLVQWQLPATLLEYGPVDEAAAMQERLAMFTQVSDAERLALAAEQQLQIATATDVALLSDIHPSWLVDLLAREAPRVVGLLLRFLPSKHARFVIEHLPHGIREQLPSVVDAFAVPDAVLRMIRHRFEAHFLPMRTERRDGEFGFAHLPELSIDELVILVHDLGVEELAIALRHLPKSALRVLLNRLPFADGKMLADRMARLHLVSDALERDVRYSILEMNFDRASADQLIREIGIQALAKAMLPTDLAMVGWLKQKLAPQLAYLLQREVDTHVPANQDALAQARQLRILHRIGALAQAHIFDPAWLTRLPESVRQNLRETTHESSFQQAS